MNTLFSRTTIQQVSPNKLETYIEIVASTNPRINALERDSQLAMLAVLNKRYAKVGITYVDDMAGLEALVAKKPDLVILGMKLILLDPSLSYNDSPKVWLSEYLKRHGINFTGSDTRALAAEFNKNTAKQKVIDAGLQSAAYSISKVTEPTLAHNLTFPLFVKPTNRGASTGIDELSVAYTEAELAAKVNSIHHDYASDALIEEYLPGREFSVAVIRRPYSQSLLAMPIEITSPVDSKGNTFLSEAVKKADVEKVIAVTDPELKKALNILAIGAFKALGSRDYGRIDMRLNATGAPSFIEANLMPGLSNHGYLLRCFALNKRTSYDDMILSIVSLALERKAAFARIAVTA